MAKSNKDDVRWWCQECACLVDTPNEHSKANLNHVIVRVKAVPRYRTDLPVPGNYYEPANPDLATLYAFGPIPITKLQ